MRTITALSPTSVSLYNRSPDLWYLRYCAEHRLPRQNQTRPASAGSAFDALIKAKLWQEYNFPAQDDDHPYAARTLLAAQVEPHNLEWATAAGVNCLQQYIRCGALADLMLLAREPPQFEFQLRQLVELDGVSVPIYGIPDMSFYVAGTLVILDWKVTGYCAHSVTSPAPGYLICRDGWDHAYRLPTRSHRKRHKDANITQDSGITITDYVLEQSNPVWALQLATYAWLLGVEPGSTDYITAVDQLCGVPDACKDHPDVRVASYRAKISKGFQETVIGYYSQCWLAYQSGHIFLTESRSASNDRVAFLENLVEILMTGDPDSQEFLAAVDYLSGKDVYDAKRDYRADVIIARRAGGETGLPDPDDYTGVAARNKATTRAGLIDLGSVCPGNS